MSHWQNGMPVTLCRLTLVTGITWPGAPCDMQANGNHFAVNRKNSATAVICIVRFRLASGSDLRTWWEWFCLEHSENGFARAPSDVQQTGRERAERKGFSDSLVCLWTTSEQHQQQSVTAAAPSVCTALAGSTHFQVTMPVILLCILKYACLPSAIFRYTASCRICEGFLFMLLEPLP